jgi:1-acyl-sn-glycerol-3-phosphate acyltransferase
VLAANHTGYLDGALVLALAPRPSHFLVLASMFDGLVGRVLWWSGQIPLEQSRGDRAGLGAALEVLGRGGVIGIFPEGGRGRGDVAVAGKGVAWLALRSGAIVVPTACLGTRRTGDLAASWPPLRSRLVVDFGRPVVLDLPPGLPGRARLDLATERIREALEGHVRDAAERHGIPLPTDVPPDLVA